LNAHTKRFHQQKHNLYEYKAIPDTKI